jgi:hypothetical protein
MLWFSISAGTMMRPEIALGLMPGGKSGKRCTLMA